MPGNGDSERFGSEKVSEASEELLSEEPLSVRREAFPKKRNATASKRARTDFADLKKRLMIVPPFLKSTA